MTKQKQFKDLFGRVLNVGDTVADISGSRSGFYCGINEILDITDKRITLKGTYKIPKGGVANLLIVDRATLPTDMIQRLP